MNNSLVNPSSSESFPPLSFPPQSFPPICALSAASGAVLRTVSLLIFHWERFLSSMNMALITTFLGILLATAVGAIVGLVLAIIFRAFRFSTFSPLLRRILLTLAGLLSAPLGWHLAILANC